MDRLAPALVFAVGLSLGLGAPSLGTWWRPLEAENALLRAENTELLTDAVLLEERLEILESRGHSAEHLVLHWYDVLEDTKPCSKSKLRAGSCKLISPQG